MSWDLLTIGFANSRTVSSRNTSNFSYSTELKFREVGISVSTILYIRITEELDTFYGLPDLDSKALNHTPIHDPICSLQASGNFLLAGSGN